MMLLSVKHVKKTYGKGLQAVDALNHMNLEVARGEFVAVMGESGSGKSTLLKLIATFDTVTEGQIIVDDIALNRLRHKEIARFRREKLGFIFQDFNIITEMTNRENIIMPLVLANELSQTITRRLQEVSQQLGISNILHQYPLEVSGGQQQRVAIARALITQPQLLLADEPTGALDSYTSKQLMELFQELNQREQTILMVTHSNIDASYARRVIFIKDGRLYHEIYRGEESRIEFQYRIADSLALLNGRGL